MAFSKTGDTYSCSQLQVVVTLHALLRDRLGHTLGVTSLKLARQEISQPALQQGGDSSHEEQPHTPAWSPEAATRTFPHRTLA